MAIFRKINSSKSANFGAFFHEIPLYKLHWIFWVVKWWKFAPQKMQVAYIHVWLLLTGSMLWMLIVHLKKNQLATYHGSITIPTIIKIFSINFNFFSKNQLLLTMLKVLKILFDITINWKVGKWILFDISLSERLAVQCVYLCIAKLLGIYFFHLTCKNFLEFFFFLIYESEKKEKIYIYIYWSRRCQNSKGTTTTTTTAIIHTKRRKRRIQKMYQNMHDCTTLYTIVRFDIN